MIQAKVFLLSILFASSALAVGPIPELSCRGTITSDCANKAKCACHATGHGGTPDCAGSAATRLMEQCVQQCTCKYPTPPPSYNGGDCPPDYTGKRRKRDKFGKCIVMRKRDAEPEPEAFAFAEPEPEADAWFMDLLDDAFDDEL